MSFSKGESSYYDLFHKDKDYKKEALKIKKMFPKAVTVLEIGCGTGNMTVELEKLGFDVLGIDPSKGMLKKFKGKKSVWCTLEGLSYPKKKYDLVLALYDVLNYIPEFETALNKMSRLGNQVYYEVWPDQPVKLYMYKRIGKYKRIRLGFKFESEAYLWYIYWGKGLVIDFHKLYLH